LTTTKQRVSSIVRLRESSDREGRERTYSGRTIIPFPSVTIRTDEIDTFFNDDTVTDQIVEVDLISVHPTKITVPDFDSTRSSENSSSSRTRIVERRTERSPIDFGNVLIRDSFARFTRVVVGADDDGVTFRVSDRVVRANVDGSAVSFEIPLHLPPSFSFCFPSQVPLVSLRDVSFRSLEFRQVSIRESSRRD